MRVVVALTVLLFLVAGAWWWSGVPRTPKELYEARCSACHALADLSRHRPEELVAIIDTGGGARDHRVSERAQGALSPRARPVKIRTIVPPRRETVL
jgi:hypothetical protein